MRARLPLVLLTGRLGLLRSLSRQELLMAEISPLRRRMIEDMTVRNLSPSYG
jgi:hypothetical protein